MKVVHIFRGLPFSLLPVLLFIARRILYKIKGIDVLVCVLTCFGLFLSPLQRILLYHYHHYVQKTNKIYQCLAKLSF